MDKSKVDIRKIIKINMKQNNISLDYLSKKTGINKIKLYFLLNNSFSSFTLMTALSICKCLNIKVSSLFE